MSRGTLGIEDPKLLIDDEPNKALQNSKCRTIFLEFFRR
jgi:hypothetical protein